MHSTSYVRLEGLDDTTGGDLFAFCFLVSNMSFFTNYIAASIYYTI